jgi:hypothetical protein
MATTRTRDAEFGDAIVDAEFGDRRRHHRRHKKHPYYGAFGNATKRKLKRPYKRSVVRKGRKLIGKRKIGHVEAKRNEFKWVTRGGGVYAAKVSKGSHKKAARKPARKHAKRGRKK